MLWNIFHNDPWFLLTENSVRHIDTLRQMEVDKRHYQIRCAICGKNWTYMQQHGYSDPKQVYAAEKDD